MERRDFPYEWNCERNKIQIVLSSLHNEVYPIKLFLWLLNVRMQNRKMGVDCWKSPGKDLLPCKLNKLHKSVSATFIYYFIVSFS